MKSKAQLTVLLAISLAIGLAYGSDLPGSFLLAGAWLAFLVTTLLSLLADRTARSSVSPVLVVGGQVVVYGAFLPVWLLSSDQTSLLGIDYRAWYPAAAALTAVAGAAFCFGYLLRVIRNPMARPGLQIDDGRPEPSPLPGANLVLLVAVALTAYAVAHPGGASQGAVTGYLTEGPQYLAGAAVYVAWRTERQWQRWAAIGLFVVSEVVFFHAFIRYTFVITTLAAGLLVLWRRRTSPLISWRWLAVAVAGVFFAIGLLGSVRSQHLNQSSTGPSVEASALGSLDVFNPLAAAIATTHGHDYLLGTSYTYLFEQVIPRSLWPGKPLPPTVQAIYRFTNSQEGRAFPIWGEMYVNFGWTGVVGGMLLSGYVAAAAMALWLRHRQRLPGLDVIAAFSIPLLLQWASRGYFVQAVYNSFGFLAAPAILLFLETRPVRRPRAGVIAQPRRVITA